VSQQICVDHSGHEARIDQCEKNDVDIFKRLLGLEKEVWKAAGASGIITGIVTAGMIVFLEKVVK